MSRRWSTSRLSRFGNRSVDELRDNVDAFQDALDEAALELETTAAPAEPNATRQELAGELRDLTLFLQDLEARVSQEADLEAALDAATTLPGLDEKQDEIRRLADELR